MSGEYNAFDGDFSDDKPSRKRREPRGRSWDDPTPKSKMAVWTCPSCRHPHNTRPTSDGQFKKCQNCGRKSKVSLPKSGCAGVVAFLLIVAPVAVGVFHFLK